MRTEFLDRFKRVFPDPRFPDPVRPDIEDLVFFLDSEDPGENAYLFDKAAEVRDIHCGRRMVVRGLLEFSSHCSNTCLYCGLNRNNLRAQRYRLSAEEIIEGAALVHAAGIRTIVMQSGEDSFPADRLAEAIREIKKRFDLAITLSVGERNRADYALWKEAGADRYLLRIESTDEKLYRSMHIGREVATRLECLENLRGLGYQVGSGIMVGPPGQTAEILARDILFLAERECDMIGIGPFIPHPDTPFGSARAGGVPLTLRTLALLRLLTRNAWLPATTALGSMDRDYRTDALKAGANVLMPNFSPREVKTKYEIYPGKRCVTEGTGACAGCTERIAREAGLELDLSRADSLKMKTAPDYASRAASDQ